MNRVRKALKWSGLTLAAYFCLVVAFSAMEFFGTGIARSIGAAVVDILAYPVNGFLGSHRFQERFLPFANFLGDQGLGHQAVVYCVQVLMLTLVGGLFTSASVGLLVLVGHKTESLPEIRGVQQRKGH